MSEPRIENLTPHEVVLDVGRGQTVALPPNGFARVADVARAEMPLNTTVGPLRLVMLHPKSEITGLPDPQPGVLYLVSRLTALAAADREDLVFPYDERREDGRIVGARGLAQFSSAGPTREWLRPDGPSDRPRSGPVDWVADREGALAVAFAVATALLSASLGIVPDVLNEGWTWHEPGNPGRELSLVGLFLGGALALGLAVAAWTRRRGRARDHGTAYLVKEDAEAWAREESPAFRALVRREFAKTLDVPGPGRLTRRWAWPLGAGAEAWDAKVDELVLAFRATRHNDTTTTKDALFIWAWWAVAVAFGSRAMSADRDLVLDVRQRPSPGGRSGDVRSAELPETPHTFRWGQPLKLPAEVQPGLTEEELSYEVNLDVTSRSPFAGHDGDAHVALLLVRFLPSPLSDLTTSFPAANPPGGASLAIDDAAGLGLPAATSATVRELRCLAPRGDFLRWGIYPWLAHRATTWIAQQGQELKGHTLLLGMLAPQEVSLGIGINAGQAGAPAWPDTLWPLIWDGHRQVLVVPRLNLGRSSYTRSGPR